MSIICIAKNLLGKLNLGPTVGISLHNKLIMSFHRKISQETILDSHHYHQFQWRAANEQLSYSLSDPYCVSV
jgi:hypothetical protein